MRKTIIVAILLLMATFAIYFTLFKKNKNLYYIPENADYVLLIDVKNVAKTYLYQYLSHPSQWTKQSKQKNKANWRNSGIETPDFLQIFHLKNTPFSEWYCIVEIQNPEKFLQFLAQEKYIKQSDNFYKNDTFSIKTHHNKCIIGLGKPKSFSQFQNLSLFLQQDHNSRKTYLATDFIENSHGSFSTLSDNKTQHFLINVEADKISIKNATDAKNSTEFITLLQQNNLDIQVELDEKNLRFFKNFYTEKSLEIPDLKKITAVADAELVNDTIVSYGFDDNFNEVKKVSFQKILQPNYNIGLWSDNSQKNWNYFQEKNWISAKNEFTAIPFLPNVIAKTNWGLQITSTRKQEKSPKIHNRNFVFYKNNSLIINALKSLPPQEKKILTDLDYFFYENKNQEYFAEFKFKKHDLPLILRW